MSANTAVGHTPLKLVSGGPHAGDNEVRAAVGEGRWDSNPGDCRHEREAAAALMRSGSSCSSAIRVPGALKQDLKLVPGSFFRHEFSAVDLNSAERRRLAPISTADLLSTGPCLQRRPIDV